MVSAEMQRCTRLRRHRQRSQVPSQKRLQLSVCIFLGRSARYPVGVMTGLEVDQLLTDTQDEQERLSLGVFSRTSIVFSPSPHHYTHLEAMSYLVYLCSKLRPRQCCLSELFSTRHLSYLTPVCFRNKKRGPVNICQHILHGDVWQWLIKQCFSSVVKLRTS